MKVENNKIVEATEAELYFYWLKSGYENIYSFKEYVAACIKVGTSITDLSEDATRKILAFH